MNIYSKDWAKVGSYADQMGTLALPFWGGSCEMVEDEKYIYIYTSYKDTNGHQYATNEIFSKEKNIFVPFKDWPFYFLASASHSYKQQLLIANNGQIFMAGHGDGSPRAVFHSTK
ncbi:MAG TPA: hypothetical protein DHV96_05725 [Lachnospiraceae bacterium]|nr:hypothetical protein [Lachnospiraceae bacterium]